MANTLNAFRNRASLLANAFGVGFIDWLDAFILPRPWTVQHLEEMPYNQYISVPVHSRTGPRPQRNIDNASHAHRAVRSTEVIIKASTVKSDAVLRATVGKNWLAAVYVIRRTKPAISHAINPAGDTVAVADPIPAHGLALCGVEYVRHEGKALPYGDIQHRRREMFARRRPGAWSRCWSGRSRLRCTK